MNDCYNLGSAHFVDWLLTLNTKTNKSKHKITYTLLFFLKHFSGPESGILEFDWLLTRVPPVQFFPIRTGFLMVTT